MNIVNLVMYNLHGVNQGKLFLNELCENNDLVCVQEHWLMNEECYRPALYTKLHKCSSIFSLYYFYSSRATFLT